MYALFKLFSLIAPLLANPHPVFASVGADVCYRDYPAVKVYVIMNQVGDSALICNEAGCKSEQYRYLKPCSN